MIMLDPENYEEWAKEIEMYEALNYCKEWGKYRRWIISNGVSITEFDQEIKF